MGKYKLIVSDLAKRDLLNTASYIKYNLQEPATAERITGTILDAIATLEDMPSRVRIVNDERLAKKEIRGLYVKNYTVFFRIDESSKIVEVLRVQYSRRDWSALL